MKPALVLVLVALAMPVAADEAGNVLDNALWRGGLALGVELLFNPNASLQGRAGMLWDQKENVLYAIELARAERTPPLQAEAVELAALREEGR